MRAADLLIYQSTAAGPGRVRSKYSLGAERVSMTLYMDPTQVDTLHSFYRTTLRNGALPFAWTHPVTGSTVDIRFTPNEPPSYTWVGNKAAVQLSLEVLDGFGL